MPSLSLKSQLLAASLFMTLFVVGGMALMTFLVVSDGLGRVNAEVARDKTTTAVSALSIAAAEAREDAAMETTMAPLLRDDLALRLFIDRVQHLLEPAGLTGVEYALYGADQKPVWSSKGGIDGSASAADRATALHLGRSFRSTLRPADRLSGFFSSASLEVPVWHAPVDFPDGSKGVLDVRALPLAEERVIDSLRLPMVLMTLAIVTLMLGLMQMSSVGVLRLVDTLRDASDSIEAGHMDARLPEIGRNEVGELAHSVNRLLDRLQRRSDAQVRFVADASHELATPVAGIRGYTSILRGWGSEDREVRDEAIEAIDRESRRMARLTSDLLNLLHADQGIILKHETFDINSIVRDRLATVATSAIDRGIEFAGPEGDELLMTGDPGRVEDVISILLDNAVKYTPPGGSVSATTRRDHTDIVITVTDTGRGIDPEDIERLFDRFFRSDKARAEGEGGFGLGLSIARSIVDAMGGWISVTSEPGRGAAFTVVVPRGRV